MNPTLVIWLQLTGLMAMEVAVIVGIAAQAQRLIKSAAWRRTLWQACVLGLLLLVAFEFTGVARGVFAWGRNDASMAVAPLPATNPSSFDSPIEQTTPSFESPADPQPTPHAHTAPNSKFVTPAPMIAARQPTKRLSNIAGDDQSLSILWIALAWFAGSAFVLGQAFISRLLLEVLRCKHGEMDDADLRGSIDELAARLGVHRRVRLMESSRIHSPAAFGTLRPTIGLPPQFRTTYNASQREAMLVHELAHLAGNDPAWYLLVDILTAALWWHPLTWWARRQLHAHCELAADEASMLVANGPGVLAECLVELGAKLARTPSAMPLGVAGNGFRSGLGRRVERLVKLEGNAWRPPDRFRNGLAVAIVPLALVITAILCTAWVVPPALNKGENMQTMKQTWKKSLAALALLTAISPDGDRALAQTADSPSIAVIDAASVDAQPKAAGSAQKLVRIDRADKSSGPLFIATGHGSQPGTANLSKEQQMLQKKLERITLGSIHYDGLPLGEVVNNLIEISSKQDQDGINFVLNRTVLTVPLNQTIDPNTGLPMPPQGNDDLNSITIHINPPLKNVRLIDVLDAITKTADKPIHFTVEDYGVVFTAGASPKVTTRQVSFQDRLTPIARKTSVDAKGGPGALEVMTFKLDTNTFFVNMERTFGEKLLNDRPSQVRATLIDIFQRSFGINLAGQDKALFYNDANGVMMVRGTPEDMAAMTGAIEMLGGTPYTARAPTVSSGSYGGATSGH